MREDQERILQTLDEMCNRSLSEGLHREARMKFAETMISYCMDHFEEEEKAMRLASYPHLEGHLREHEYLQQRLIEVAVNCWQKGDHGRLLDLKERFLTHLFTWDESFFVWKAIGEGESSDLTVA
jgi:hemerythrin